MSKWAEDFKRMPVGVHTKKFEREGLALEWIVPEGANPQKVLLYFHGGGFVFPLWFPLKRISAYLAHMTKFRMLAVHYRLAPEHPFPAAVDDCVASYRWLITEGDTLPQNIVLMGESAGGNLVIATLLVLRDAGDPLPAGAAAICAPFSLADDRDPSNTPADPMILPGFAMAQFDAYRAGADPHEPLVSPIYADLTGLPPLLIQAGEAEMFYPDAVRFASLAEQAGVLTTLDTWPEMWHFWHLFFPFLPEARQALEAIMEFVCAAVDTPVR